MQRSHGYISLFFTSIKNQQELKRAKSLKGERAGPAAPGSPLPSSAGDDDPEPLILSIHCFPSLEDGDSESKGLTKEKIPLNRYTVEF